MCRKNMQIFLKNQKKRSVFVWILRRIADINTDSNLDGPEIKKGKRWNEKI